MNVLPWHRSEFDRLIAAKATLPHALLLRGPRGIGKLAFARALARALLCESPGLDGTACGACGACTWFDAGGHPDFRQVDPANAAEVESDEDGKIEKKEKKAIIGVDEIRALGAFVNVASHRGGPKAVVIHPVEALNPNASNALLKNLEEPPRGVHFLLVTHRPHQLLPTIKSRCQQVALRVPEASAAATWLAEQGVRDASLALAHGGDAPLLALELNGTEYWGARAAFLRHLTARGIDVLAAGEAVRDCPIPHVVAWMQKWSYDLVHYRAVGRVRYNPDYSEVIARAAGAVDPLGALRFHREMVQLQRLATHPLNARLFIEQVLLGYRDLFESQGAIA